MDVVIEAGVEQADVEKVRLRVGARAEPVVGEQRDNMTEYRRQNKHDDGAQQDSVNQLHRDGSGGKI